MLVLWGDQDPFLSIDNAELMQARIPGARLYVLSGCGHFAHEDAGDAWTSILKDWRASSIDAQSDAASALG